MTLVLILTIVYRANFDLQKIVDVQACAQYMAKYAAKSRTSNSAFPFQVVC